MRIRFAHRLSSFSSPFETRTVFAPLVAIENGMLVAGGDKRLKALLRKPTGLADAKEGKRTEMQGQNSVKLNWPKDGRNQELVEWEAMSDAGAEVKLENDYGVIGQA